jgi:hypothetical protein
VIDAETGVVVEEGWRSSPGGPLTDAERTPRGRYRIWPMRFTVGVKLKSKADHTVVEAEDALIAALKVKSRHPEARVIYVRPANRRGDARHPAHDLSEERA